MRHRKRILVVDDSEVIQDVLKEFLRGDYTGGDSGQRRVGADGGQPEQAPCDFS